jgi:hypothetical protein
MDHPVDRDIMLPFNGSEFRDLKQVFGLSSRKLAVTLKESLGLATRHSSKNLKREALHCNGIQYLPI